MEFTADCNPTDRIGAKTKRAFDICFSVKYRASLVLASSLAACTLSLSLVFDATAANAHAIVAITNGFPDFIEAYVPRAAEE